MRQYNDQLPQTPAEQRSVSMLKDALWLDRRLHDRTYIRTVCVSYARELCSRGSLYVCMCMYMVRSCLSSRGIAVHSALRIRNMQLATAIWMARLGRHVAKVSDAGVALLTSARTARVFAFAQVFDVLAAGVSPA